ncbi:acyltransferase domain-containing protein [Verminephrobacter aporrectodeae]|uniref:acyltransferase domain-containing protein n=1 Tax=Verminephrobacter aporrectodeae TaxID=1110389 RepID=UPI002243E028|nr:acyltransferase domain-containing protein [Verminephrobacter aporrectodeae]MCW8177553.1 acyltransferase domain-containing protein [Verminephrobacter aporrectodeae subsp. tuberculatae]MCW8204908.1 acyltransferase domain-containing protein [Verminephrobacter aporrectodeae subsp. tuberculatae]
MSIVVHAGDIDTNRNAGVIENVTNVALQTRRFAFAFPGSGVQHPRMGRALYETNSAFRVAFDECRSILAVLGGFDIAAALFSARDNTAFADAIKSPGKSGVCIFSYQYAMTRTLAEIGIFPSVVFGHSLGEYSAAVAAGALSLHDGLTLVHHRGLLLDSLKGNGAMVIAAAAVEMVRPMLISGTHIVAVNGPYSTGIAGTTEQIDLLCTHFESAGCSFHRIRFGSASHCDLVNPIIPGFEKVLQTLNPMPSTCDWYSTHKNELLPAGFLPDVSYWVGQLKNPVFFAQAVSSIHDSDEQCIFLEIGPQNGLSGLISSTAPNAHVIPLSGHANDDRGAHTVLAHAINSIKAIIAGDEGELADLPTEDEQLTDLEFVVLQVWMEALRSRSIRSTDNFFEIGGHSMLAARVASDLSEMFGVPLPTNLMAKSSTAFALASALMEHCINANVDANVVAKTWRMAYEQTEDQLEEAVRA